MTYLEELEALQMRAQLHWKFSIAQIDRIDQESGDEEPWFFSSGPETQNIHQAEHDARFVELLTECSEDLVVLAMTVHSFMHTRTSENRTACLRTLQDIVERLDRQYIKPHGP